MKKTLSFLVMTMAAIAAQATEIATCRDPMGRAYFHYSNLGQKDRSGWNEEKITGGTFSLSQADNGEFDVLYVDWRKKPISSAQDGARVLLLQRGFGTLTLLVAYSSGVTEIYTFFEETDGTNRFTILQSRAGDAVPFPKSSLMVGTCGPIRFKLVK